MRKVCQSAWILDLRPSLVLRGVFSWALAVFSKLNTCLDPLLWPPYTLHNLAKTLMLDMPESVSCSILNMLLVPRTQRHLSHHFYHSLTEQLFWDYIFSSPVSDVCSVPLVSHWEHPLSILVHFLFFDFFRYTILLNTSASCFPACAQCCMCTCTQHALV